VRPEGLGKVKTFDDLIGTRTRDLSARSVAPPISTLPQEQKLQDISLMGYNAVKSDEIFS
jgi:hypothetical protein